MRFEASEKFRRNLFPSNSLLLNYLLDNTWSFRVDEKLEVLPDNKKLTYLDYTQGTDTISYLDRSNYLKEKEKSENRDFWKSDLRREAKPGKVFSRWKGKRGFTDVDIEKAVNVFRANALDVGNYEFVVVKGRDIRKFYLEKNYDFADERFHLDTLGNSCMREKAQQKFLDIYVQNWRKVSLLMFKRCDSDKILGRALLWKDVWEGLTLMDKPYGCNIVIEKFESFAKENGYLYRNRDIWAPSMNFILPNGEKRKIKISVNVKCNYEKYPYMDTFRYTDLKGRMSNTDRPWTSSGVLLTSVKGNTHADMDDDSCEGCGYMPDECEC